MKKYFSVLMALLCILSVFCGCSDTQNTKETSAPASTDKADTTTVAPTTEAPEDTSLAAKYVKIYMDNIDMWKYTPEANQQCGYLFLDLNSDGVLELIQSTSTGYENKSNNKYYAIDTATETVFEVPFPDKDEENQCDFNESSYPQIYKNNATGKIHFLTANQIKSEEINTTYVIGEMYMDENFTIKAKNLWELASEYNPQTFELSSEEFFVYDENGEKTSVYKSTYEATLAKYEEENTNLLLKKMVVSGIDSDSDGHINFSDLDYDNQYKLLLESYNTYSYQTAN